MCVQAAQLPGGSVLITKYQSLNLSPGEVLPVCVAQ